MGTRARSVVFAAALVVALTLGCAAKRTPLARLPPPCVLSLVGDRILCDGEPYAEIVRRGCTTKKEARGEAYLVPPGHACRALGIRYADGSRVTIFTARSMDLWEGAGYAARTKGEAIADWAYDIDFDPPSRRVTFRRAGIFSTSRWAYDVGTGRLIEID